MKFLTGRFNSTPRLSALTLGLTLGLLLVAGTARAQTTTGTTGGEANPQTNAALNPRNDRRQPAANPEQLPAANGAGTNSQRLGEGTAPPSAPVTKPVAKKPVVVPQTGENGTESGSPIVVKIAIVALVLVVLLVAATCVYLIRTRIRENASAKSAPGGAGVTAQALAGPTPAWAASQASDQRFSELGAQIGRNQQDVQRLMTGLNETLLELRREAGARAKAAEGGFQTLAEDTRRANAEAVSAANRRFTDLEAKIGGLGEGLAALETTTQRLDQQGMVLAHRGTADVAAWADEFLAMVQRWTLGTQAPGAQAYFDLLGRETGYLRDVVRKHPAGAPIDPDANGWATLFGLTRLPTLDGVEGPEIVRATTALREYLGLREAIVATFAGRGIVVIRPRPGDAFDFAQHESIASYNETTTDGSREGLINKVGAYGLLSTTDGGAVLKRALVGRYLLSEGEASPTTSPAPTPAAISTQATVDVPAPVGSPAEISGYIAEIVPPDVGAPSPGPSTKSNFEPSELSVSEEATHVAASRTDSSHAAMGTLFDAISAEAISTEATPDPARVESEPSALDSVSVEPVETVEPIEPIEPSPTRGAGSVGRKI